MNYEILRVSKSKEDEKRTRCFRFITCNSHKLPWNSTAKITGNIVVDVAMLSMEHLGATERDFSLH